MSMGKLDTEHLLLGLLRDDHAASQMLTAVGIARNRIRHAISKIVPKRESKPLSDMTLTPDGKRVIDLAYEEARGLNHNFIGTQHLLLGLVREAHGPAAKVLIKLGADLDRLRGLANTRSERISQADAAQARSFTSPEARALALLPGSCLREHLLFSILSRKQGRAATIVSSQCDDLEGLRLALALQIETASASGIHRLKADDLATVLVRAQREASAEELTSVHLLLALLHEDDSPFSELVRKFGIGLERSRELAQGLD